MAVLVAGPSGAIDMTELSFICDTRATGSVDHVTIDQGDGTVSDLTGSFSFDETGHVSSGTITGIDQTRNGVQVYSITGIDAFDFETTRDLIQSGDVQYLLSQFILHDDTIIGGSGDDHLLGGAGHDLLQGGAGNDVLDGQFDYFDTLEGGVGDDTYIVHSNGDRVVEALGEGTDTIRSDADLRLADNVENLILQNNAERGDGNALSNRITGDSSANILKGHDGNDRLIGHGGDDFLYGGAGRDKMSGGSGDDTYYVGNRHDEVIEHAGHGYDRVFSSVSFTLKGWVEDLTLTGSAHHATGNDLGNHITGNNRNNTIYGMDGDDILFGGKGDDHIYGGRGRDSMSGGDGADTFFFADGDLGTSKATADGIGGFLPSEGDRIDLTALDAIPGGGHDVFAYIGKAEFDGKAGELRFEKDDNTHAYLMADTDGDKHADLYICLAGYYTDFNDHHFTTGSVNVAL